MRKRILAYPRGVGCVPRLVWSLRRPPAAGWLLPPILLAGCAAATPRPAGPPARSEIVVEEATVVQARAPGERDGLPPLPRPLSASSQGFAQGYRLARPLLRAAGPAAPPEADQAGYDTWLRATLAPWLQARGDAVQAALRPLAQIDAAAPAERVPAAALVGLLYLRAHQQLLAVPPPPSVRADSKLLDIYLDQVNATSASWVQNAERALRGCAVAAAAQSQPVYAAWLDLCQQQLAQLQQQNSQAAALHARVLAEQQAEASASEGAQPAAPDGTTAASAPPGAKPGAGTSQTAPDAGAPEH